METTPVRIWSGVHEALQVYSGEKQWDMSVLASFLLMGALFQQEDLPEKAQVAVVRTFFELVGEGIMVQKEEIAQWVVKLMRETKKAQAK